jgi:hypothetical protein
MSASPSSLDLRKHRANGRKVSAALIAQSRSKSWFGALDMGTNRSANVKHTLVNEAVKNLNAIAASVQNFRPVKRAQVL